MENNETIMIYSQKTSYKIFSKININVYLHFKLFYFIYALLFIMRFNLHYRLNIISSVTTYLIIPRGFSSEYNESDVDYFLRRYFKFTLSLTSTARRKSSLEMLQVLPRQVELQHS